MAPRSKKEPAPKRPVTAGALPAEALEGDFPPIALPVHPPFPPMEARSAERIPSGGGWLYEPKWDGFRCLAFRKGKEVLLQSKACQPLGRYFPELVEALAALPMSTFAFDGEIVISRDGVLAFDDLLQRIHPAESRIRKLSRETPASLYIFDLLVDPKGKSLVDQPLEERRKRLEEVFTKIPERSEGASAILSPATRDRGLAEKWITELGAAGLDGVVAKQLEAAYLSGDRGGMVKIKRMRTADCVVGGFRQAQSGEGLGSLLLGLHNEQGELDHVGFSSSFSAAERKEVEKIVKPYAGGRGFTGKAPGGPSRWSQGRSTEWVPLDPVLVCEVRYDHFSGGRFRHGTKFLRWRPDKDPAACTFAQVQAGGPGIRLPTSSSTAGSAGSRAPRT